uniref:Uncharacterized protein n=1 Tax=Romanomermis culicivorax TaxID=13658 RepID=A0A915IMM7_ROMCU
MQTKIADDCPGGCGFPGSSGCCDSHGGCGIVMTIKTDRMRMGRIAAVVGGIAAAGKRSEGLQS